MPAIQAVIFDMGDIFFDATPWRRKVAAYLADQGMDIDYSRLVPLWEKALVPVYVGKKPYWEAFGQFVSDVGLTEEQAVEAESAARQFSAEIKERVLFDGVADTLAELKKRGLKLAVLSDTESGEQAVRERLVRLGIEQHFDAVLTSHDLGAVKPMPEAFEAALEQVGCQVGEAAFVAHDLDELEGSMQFGLKTIAYNYEPGVPADHFLDHFSELVNAVCPDKPA